MKKEEILEAIAKIMRETGISPDEVFAYLQSNKQLPKNTVALRYQTPEGVVPGMYVYTDGLISAKLIKNRQIKAVVGDIQGSDVLAVCLREKILCWTDAAQYCRDYSEYGVKRGEAFFPSITELERLYGNKGKINASLKQLDGFEGFDGEYWSSTERSANFAWTLFSLNGGRWGGYKHYYNYVRPVLAFSI